MNLFNSEEYHHQSKSHLRDGVPIPESSDDWPKEWTTIYFKGYPDLAKIELPPTSVRADLFEVISQRKSVRNFTQQPISLAEISAVLKYSCGLHQEIRSEGGAHGDIVEHHRAQPSGGGRFPIEVYLVNFVSGEVPAGVFHYNVRDHQLTVLETRQFSPDDIRSLFTYPYVRQASCAIVLTAVFWRNQIKYGERGYRYVLHEAGHIGQNISLVGNALGLKSVMMGGSIDSAIEKLIDIDGITESLVYSVILGK